jgi:hypothetical protein
MAAGFPLLLAEMGLLGTMMADNRPLTDRRIKIPVVAMGLAWLRLGFIVWQH